MGIRSLLLHPRGSGLPRRYAPRNDRCRDCLKLLDLRSTTSCSPTLIRLAALSTFPKGEGMTLICSFPSHLPLQFPIGQYKIKY